MRMRVRVMGEGEGEGYPRVGGDASSPRVLGCAQLIPSEIEAAPGFRVEGLRVEGDEDAHPYPDVRPSNTNLARRDAASPLYAVAACAVASIIQFR